MPGIQAGAAFVTLQLDRSAFNRDLDRARADINRLAAAPFRVAVPALVAVNAARAAREQARGFRDAAIAEARATVRAIRAAAVPAGGGIDWSSLLNRAGFRTAARALQVQGSVAAARAQAEAGVAGARARGQGQVSTALADARTFWKTEAVAAAGKVGATLLRAGVGFGSLLARGSMSVVSGVAQAVASLAKGLLSAATSFVESLVSGVRNLGLAGIGAGIGGAAFSAREAMSMESREVALRRATGLGPEANAGLMGKLKGMGGTMPGVGLEDVFGTATMGAKLGVAGPQLELFTKDMLRLRTVFDETDMPLAEATTGLVRLAQLFGTGYQAMDRFAATLIRLDNLSSASARDILDISARMGGTLSAFKVTASDTLALAAALREAGVPLETAATSITQIMQRMVSKRDIGVFAKTAGMDKATFEAGVRTNPMEALLNVVHGLGQTGEGRETKALSAVDASRQLEKMHLDGQRVRGTLLALTRVEDKLVSLLNEGRDEWETTAHFLEAVAAKAGITESQLTLMWNRIKLLAAEIGAGLLPVLKGFSDGLGGLAAELKGFFEAQRETMVAWGARMGRTLGYVKLLWREWPTFVQLAWIKTQEFGERVATVMDRVGKVIRNAFEMAFDFVVDAVPKVATFIGESFVHSLSQAFRVKNPFLDMMIEQAKRRSPIVGAFLEAERNKGAGPAPVPPDFGKFDPGRVRERLMRGVGPQGMFGGLPDRGLDVMAQEKHLEGVRAAMEGAGAGAAGAGDAADAINRAAANTEKAIGAGDVQRRVEERRRAKMTPAARAAEDNRKRRMEMNRTMRQQRAGMNAAMRGGRVARKKVRRLVRPPDPGFLKAQAKRAEEALRERALTTPAMRQMFGAGAGPGMFGEGGMPEPGKPPVDDQANKRIEVEQALTTAMIDLLGGLQDIQRTGVVALFG